VIVLLIDWQVRGSPQPAGLHCFPSLRPGDQGPGPLSQVIPNGEPVFVNLLRRPGIDSQPCEPVRQHNLSYRPARLHRLAESIRRNRFLGSLNVHKYGFRFSKKLGFFVAYIDRLGFGFSCNKDPYSGLCKIRNQIQAFSGSYPAYLWVIKA
jgi:hypothetical protein